MIVVRTNKDVTKALSVLKRGLRGLPLPAVLAWELPEGLRDIANASAIEAPYKDKRDFLDGKGPTETYTLEFFVPYFCRGFSGSEDACNISEVVWHYRNGRWA